MIYTLSSLLFLIRENCKVYYEKQIAICEAHGGTEGVSRFESYTVSFFIFETNLQRLYPMPSWRGVGLLLICSLVLGNEVYEN